MIQFLLVRGARVSRIVREKLIETSERKAGREILGAGIGNELGQNEMRSRVNEIPRGPQSVSRIISFNSFIPDLCRLGAEIGVSTEICTCES